jgi:uncharacterized protein (TIGR04222 family)
MERLGGKMPNPFQLDGPSFLLFYFTVVLLSHLLIYIIRLSIAGGEIPKVSMQDPYLIAYLSKGKEGVIQLAVLKLVNEKKLTVTDGNRLICSDNSSSKEPIEKTILNFFRDENTTKNLLKSKLFDPLLKSYHTKLTSLGLLPTDLQIQLVGNTKLFLALALFALSAFRIYFSILSGHYNLLFLVILTFLGIITILVFHDKTKSLKGKTFLNHLKSTLQTSRSISHSGNNLSYLLAAASGFIILGELGAQNNVLFPHSNSSNSSGTSGSSCSSSSCSSGDSSCGGGCGGCGGGD